MRGRRHRIIRVGLRRPQRDVLTQQSANGSIRGAAAGSTSITVERRDEEGAVKVEDVDVEDVDVEEVDVEEVDVEEDEEFDGVYGLQYVH